MRLTFLSLGAIFAVVLFHTPGALSKFRVGFRFRGGPRISRPSRTRGGAWNKGGGSGTSGTRGGAWNKGGGSGTSGTRGGAWNKGGSSGSSASRRWGTSGSGTGTGSASRRWLGGGSRGSSGSSASRRWGTSGSGTGTGGASRRWLGGGSGSLVGRRWGTSGKKTGTGSVGSGASSSWSSSAKKTGAVSRWGSSSSGSSSSGMTPKQRWGSAAERAVGSKTSWKDVVKQAKEKNAKQVAAKEKVKSIAGGIGESILSTVITTTIAQSITLGFTKAGQNALLAKKSTTGVIPTKSCSEADKKTYTKVAIYHLSAKCTDNGAKMTEQEKVEFIMKAIIQMCANPATAKPNCNAKSSVIPGSVASGNSGSPKPTSPAPVTCANAEIYKRLAIYQMSDNCDGSGKRYTKAKYDQEVTDSITVLCKNPKNAFPKCPAKCPKEKTWESLGKHELSDACKGTGKKMNITDYALYVMKLIDKMCQTNPNPDTVKPNCST